jgi:hypothetical protein
MRARSRLQHTQQEGEAALEVAAIDDEIEKAVV